MRRLPSIRAGRNRTQRPWSASNWLGEVARRAAAERGQAASHVPAPGWPGAARIIVERPEAGRVDRLRGYEVVVDGHPSGLLMADEKLELPVEAGEHVVQVRIDWCRSQALSVKSAPDRTTRLTACPRSPWAWLFWVSVGARRYPSLHVNDSTEESTVAAGEPTGATGG